MRIKEVLKKYGITQNELAERMGINRVSVSRLLSESNDMRTSTVVKIADAIGCNVSELFEEPASESKEAVSNLCPHCGKHIRIRIE